MTIPRGLQARGSIDPSPHTVYKQIGHESALGQAIARARVMAGLTQAEVARRMRTTQSNVARMEAGRTTPSTRTLERFANAIGARLTINFEPLRLG
jgi:ribosome-binding protein aMBF1 (putative translation factor)